MEPSRRQRIDLGEPLMQNFAAFASPFRRQTLAHRFIDRRSIEETVQERLEVQWRSADKESAFPACRDFAIASFRLRQPPGDARGLPRIENVQQMMPDRAVDPRRVSVSPCRCPGRDTTSLNPSQ